jgi:hypothetical protein
VKQRVRTPARVQAKPRAHLTRVRFCAVLLLALSLGVLVPDGSRHIVPASASAAAWSARSTVIPSYFEINRGQAPRNIRFLLRGQQAVAGFLANSITFGIETGRARASHHRDLLDRKLAAEKQTESFQTLRFLGAQPHPSIAGRSPLPGRVNYFIGSDPHRWHTDIPTFGRLLYRGIYPHTDMIVHASRGQLEYDWVLHPGAQPARIHLRVSGSAPLRLLKNGMLEAGRGAAELLQAHPVAYQNIAGVRRMVRARFVVQSASVFGLAVARYDRRFPLVVDPTVSYSTVLGGEDTDQSTSIAVDSSGDAYVAGFTTSLQFPTVHPLQQVNAGGADAFISELNASGSALLSSTYLGGSDDDQVNGIAVGADGSVYVTGGTRSLNFPISHAFQTTPGGGDECTVNEVTMPCGDAFVTHLTAGASTLLYSTYLGTSAEESGNGISVDAQGDAFIAGATQSTSFPQVHGLPPTDFESNGCDDPSSQDLPVCRDAFVTKLSPDGTHLIYSTLVGGNSDDAATAIAIDRYGAAWITGETASVDFPQVNTTLQEGDTTDAFVVKLGAPGNAIAFSTFLGGSNDDIGDAIALDANGDASVVGETDSDDFPTSNAFMANSPGDQDAWIARFSSVGGAPLYVTFMGGDSVQQATGVAVDGTGDTFVVGNTDSSDFPTIDATQQSIGGVDCAPVGSGATNCYDAFVQQLDPGGRPVFSTYLGGDNSDQATGAALDSVGNLYVTGITPSDDFPLRGGLSLSPAGDIASFITRFGDHPQSTQTPTATPTSTVTATPTPTASPTPRPKTTARHKCKKGFKKVHGKCKRKP